MWRRKICKELGKELWDDEFEVRPSPRERGDESKRKSKSARRSHSKSIIQCRRKCSEKIKNSSRTRINVRCVCKILLQSCALSTRNSQIKKEATGMRKALVANDGPLIHSVTLTPKSMTSN